MTYLAVSIRLDRTNDLESLAQQAWGGGAEAIELRIDTFKDELPDLIAYLNHHPDQKWIVTCRSVSQGGRHEGNMEDRWEIASTLLRETDVYVDVEWPDWQAMSGEHALDQSRVILSFHDFNEKPDDMADQISAMLNDKSITASKIAYQLSDINDSFEAIDLLHQHGRRVSAIAMGEAGLWTRVLAKKFGAFVSYCALNSDEATAPGQLTLEEMVHLYRWEKLNESTLVYGVIGDPVAHSLSPLIFNRWFDQMDINAVYLPLRVSVNQDVLRQFLDGCLQRPWLNVSGFSVTIPHKSAALEWVGDGADSMANWIGALNTVVIQDGKAKGFNTDCYAAILSITDALQCDRSDLAGMKVDVLGGGGAARAILHGLREFGCQVTVYGRSAEKTQALVEEYGFVAASWEQRANGDGDLLVNCTPIGLWPAVDESPTPGDALSGYKLVFDMIYNPLQTKLLSDAQRAGATSLNGVDMFVRQAAMQFELWFGKPPDRQAAKNWIEEKIGK